MYDDNDKRLESKARRMAGQYGLAVRKSRAAFSINNLGGYMLIDPELNCVAGPDGSNRFGLTAEDVIAWCSST